MDKITQALSNCPAPPCEKFSCVYFEKCGKELLACQSFHFYVDTGKSVSPRMVWSPGYKNGRIDASVVPTHDRYLKVMRNSDASGAAQCPT